MPRISEIRVYPIKSCAGVSVDSATLEARGLSWDRRYMLVDVGGRFLTQREHPRMTPIRVQRNSNGWSVHTSEQETLEIPESLPDGLERSVRIWNDQIDVTVARQRFNEWFTMALGLPCELVQMKDKHVRPIKSRYGKPGDSVSFADGAPVLLTSEASLAELNRRLERPLPMIRFRPNLVATAERAFAEDGWRRIRVGEAELDVEWACTRCIVTTIDTVTGEKELEGEPIRTLKSFRGSSEGVMFGQNLIPRRLGTVRVGDSIEVLEDSDA